MTCMQLQLREYQVEALARIEKAVARGVRRQMGVAATGLGKTVMFCALAERMDVRTLVIAHRDELIEQAAAKVREVWHGADVGVVKGARNEVTAKVVVASIQTLARENRLAQLLAPTVFDDSPSFGLVVIDEAHHAAAKSYRDVIHALRCDEPDGPLLLGVTATPDRGDGKGLDDLFEEVVFSYDIRWGIAREYLSDLRGVRVQLGADFGKLRVTAGDFNVGQAGQMLEDADAPQLIVKAWLERAAGRRTLVFTPTVAVAEQVRDAFLAADVRAGMVSGATPIEERRATLAAYSAGELDVVANCAVLTEGYDEPRTDCIVVARPTKSRALYTQMVGRGTRRHPDKQDCLVIDVVGATEMHSLITVPSLFGVEKPERVWDSEATVTDVLRQQIEEHEREGRLIATEVALFDKVRRDGLAWVMASKPGDRRRYSLGLGPWHGRCVLLQITDGDDCSWRAGHQDREDNKTVLIDGVTLETAQAVAEEYVKRIGATKFADPKAFWRSARPTPKMQRFAGKLGIQTTPGMTRGEVHDLIEAKLARTRARKAERQARQARSTGG